MDPNGAWVRGASPDAFKWSPKAQCAFANEPGPRSHLRCLGPEEFVKDVFLDSDTDLMVLSFVPSRRDAEPVTIQAADAVRRIVDRLEGTHRLLVHGRVNPNQPGDVEAMDELAQRWRVSAWKTYTQFGPGGKGFFLSDDVGIRFIEKARALGIKVICVHKGLPFGRESYEHSQCSDIGVVAQAVPGRELPRLPLGIRDRRHRAGVRRSREPRRHRHVDTLADRERHHAELRTSTPSSAAPGDS